MENSYDANGTVSVNGETVNVNHVRVNAYSIKQAKLRLSFVILKSLKKKTSIKAISKAITRSNVRFN